MKDRKSRRGPQVNIGCVTERGTFSKGFHLEQLERALAIMFGMLIQLPSADSAMPRMTESAARGFSLHGGLHRSQYGCRLDLLPPVTSGTWTAFQNEVGDVHWSQATRADEGIDLGTPYAPSNTMRCNVGDDLHSKRRFVLVTYEHW
jgi:hypothetical protein